MRKHWPLVFLLLALVAIWTVVVSFGQQRQMGGAGITVFADSNFRGKAQTFSRDVPDLARSGMNDRISSLRIGPGEQWEVCEHANYQGRCVVVSGEESDLGRNSWSDVISSFRRVGGAGGGGSAGPTPPQGDWYIVLYDQPNYRGRVYRYKQPASSLPGLVSRAQSVTIGKGVWELCDGRNFTGRCVTLEQSVPDLNAHGLSNRVASVRPVRPQVQPR